MRARLWLALVLAGAMGLAESGHTVRDLLTMVRTAMGNRQADGKVAGAVRKFQLSERLDLQTVEELENQGAGPQTLAALHRLRESSARLRAAGQSPPDERPAPSAGEQRRIIEMARERALDYTRSLPDFICTEVLRRYEDLRNKLIDTLALQLSYSGKQENYKLLSIDGKPTRRSFDSVGGVITQGEFGSLLNEVFDPRSDTEFQWERWATVRQRSTHVYTFRVAPGKSRYRMAAVGAGERYTTPVGQHGLVYVDGESNRTIRVMAEADSIPEDFPVRAATTTLDYDFVDIGGRSFLLPLHAEARLTAVGRQTRNEVEFHSYRKFAADSSITYEPH